MSQRVDKVWGLAPRIGLDDWTIGGLNGSGISVTLGANAYTYGVSGDSLFIKFKCNHTTFLDWFMFHVAATTTNGDLRIELREADYASGADRPSSVLLASGTVTISGSPSDKWYKPSLVSALPLVRNRNYFIVIGNAGGRVSLSLTVAGRNFTDTPANCGYGTNANGFTTAPSNTDGRGFLPFVLGYVDGYEVGGGPYTNLITTGGFYSGSTTYQGLRITGLTEPRTISSVSIQATGSSRITDLAIFEDSEPPNGTPIKHITVTDRSCSNICKIFIEDLFTFGVGHSYNVVFKAAANIVTQYYKIGDLASYEAELKKVALGQGAWYGAKEVAGAWVYDESVMPFITLRGTYLGAA